MLEPWVIEELKRRERKPEQPRIPLPPPPPPEPRHRPEEKPERGVVIIQF